MDITSFIVKTTMPEHGQAGSEFADLLNEVDDPEFDKKLTRSKSNRLKSLLHLLQHDKVPTKVEAEQLLKLCTEDDRITYEVPVIFALLENTELINTLDIDILVSSALFLLDLLKHVVFTTMRLRSMTIQTILSYPDTVLIKIAVLHSEKLLETFEINSKSNLIEEYKMEVCHLLKVLTILPLVQAKAFVKQGLTTWLQLVIPMTMSYMTLSNLENPANKVVYVQYLEQLTDLLVTTDYFENVHWKNLIECICNVKKYPSIIKSLLENHSDIWHRLWIIIIKLLNNHITKNIGGFGTPINSMLPVVESAFRMDAAQRIRAFECWNKLIDNFSKETNENCIAKRIKLLIIPLKLNNAKTEDIALAKFDTWWHLIRSFEYKSERFCNDVFVPFLHFVFGKPGTTKPGVVGTQLSNRLKRKSLEAFVEIVGHSDCECSIDIPKLKDKILNMKLLVNNWNDWMFCLSNAFKNASNPAVYEVSTKNYLKCTWKSMVQLIAELPDNAVRRDIFTEMLSCILNMLKEPQSTDQLHDVIVTAIMSSLFDGSAKMQDLLKAKTDKYKPLFMITSAFTNASMTNYYTRFTEDQLINLFKPITKLVIEEAVQQENSFFNCLLPNDISLKFWTATMDNLSDLNKEISSEMLSDLMEWPLKSLGAFKEIKTPGMKWYCIYNVNHKKLNCTGFNKEVSKYIIPNLESVNYFTVCVTIGVLKQRLLNKESPGSMPKLLEKFTSSIKDYEEFKEIIPLSVDTIVVMLNNVAEKTDIELAKTALKSAKNLLRVIIAAIEKNRINNKTTENLLVLLTNLKIAINPLLKEEAYTDSVLELVEELSSHLTNITKESPLFNCIVTHMKTYMSLTNNKDLKLIINKAINPKEVTNINNQNNIINEPVKVFTRPDVKIVQKTKKTEFNIVNKVVENGEEYVVVKSNWKFNPKKLTENQKEKLQRKREDIPALYQDLSQSQDEIKLSIWKTDSQDSSTTTSTGTTNSKSTESASNNQVKSITMLKNLPNTDVVPKIMENIIQGSNKKIELLVVNDTKTIKEKIKKNGSLTPTEKIAKSPRMALKDRVFRNMKNLLEKSTPPTDKTEVDPDHTENIPKTPPNGPKNDMNVANSAPPILAADRPSRMKRRPRKFDDTELFALTKRRYSQNVSNQSDCQNDAQNDLSPMEIERNTIGVVKHVLLKESEQKTVENDSNKNTEQAKVKDYNIAESSLDIEMKNVNEDGPSKISERASARVVNEVIIESSNVNDIETSMVTHIDTVPEKEPVKDAIIETIVISESEAFTEPKEVPDGVVKNHMGPETKPECNVIVQPKPATVTTEKLPATPKHKIRVTSEPKSSTKNSAKKSRIEKELAIDMVEGHPFLKLQSEQRLTRKKLIKTELTSGKKSIAEKMNKSKSQGTPKSTKKTRDRKTSPTIQTSITVHETQEASQSPENDFLDEPVCSEDVIESSQDSTITTISTICTKKTTKRQPIITIERLSIETVKETLNLLQYSDTVLGPNKTIIEEKDDTVIPQNKTVEADKSQSQLTENMDTEPISDKDVADDVIVIVDIEETPITINSESIVGAESQEIAEADTQPNNSVDFMDLEKTNVKETRTPIEIDLDKIQHVTNDLDQIIPEITITQDKPLQADSITEAEKDLSLPFKDYDQRKKDFLNNTLEISPIKIQSPDRDKKSPSPETSSDYVVIKLSSPVHSNGEPFQKHGSPEFFTDEKISPDKRDISPPRTEISTVNNTSPSSALSLKKNKPQVRPGGRAAHMLGLCVPEKLNTMKMADRAESEEIKKVSTPARRNLRILYNTVSDNNSDSTDNDESENFLKLKRSLPSVDSSPIGPILKRKRSDITDEASPASKRKRVSFHDPPVSTTVSVHKYIEPIGLRSPQNSAQKRLERQTRQSQYSKSPKRLDNVFKLETVLSKTVESFSEGDEPTPLTDATPEDTQTSLEVTPAIEIVKTSDLNDTDPIFPKLVNCNDHIIVIAAELSSPSLKHLFVKQIEDKVKTVGDLAKMTEVDVCRLCIKAPKVIVAKKVLSDYAAKIEKPIPTVELIKETEVIEIIEANPEIETEAVVTNTLSIEIQTDEVSQNDIEVQTIVEPVTTGSTQTDALNVAHIDVQTNESGSKTTADVIATCLNEREDFIEKLSEMLEESSIRKVAEKLPANTVFDVLMDKQSTTGILDKILARESLEASGNRKSVQKCMSFMTDFMSQRFQSKDLILFCSQLLQKIHDRPA